MMRLDVGHTLQIGDDTVQFEDAVEGSGAHTQLRYGRAQPCPLRLRFEDTLCRFPNFCQF